MSALRLTKRTSVLFAAALQLSHSWALPIGSLVVPVKQLLYEPELILDQWFNLDGASPESQLLLRAELKVPPHRFTCLSILHCLVPPLL